MKKKGLIMLYETLGSDMTTLRCLAARMLCVG